MPKITVAEAHLLNKGDLDWAPLNQLGELKIHKKTKQKQLIKQCADAEVIVVNKMIIDREVITQLPKLRLICEAATGFNNIELNAASDRGIPVCNVPNYGTLAVAQHTFALLMELTNHVALHNRSVHRGDWAKKKQWTYYQKPLVELAGKTLGIVGHGRIGQAVAQIAQAYGMHVIVFHTHKIEDLQVVQVTWGELLRQSDILSLHCPLTAHNQHMINARAFELMKKGAWLVNTARGGLVDEGALVAALLSGKLGATALDVLAQEPPPRQHPLYGMRNVVITPHNAWSSKEARQRLIDATAANIAAWQAGEPQNVVNS